MIYECGGSEVFRYKTPNAGTSKASQAFWDVEDVEADMKELKARGVVFGGRRGRDDEERDRHRRRRKERFKGSDGNRLAINQRIFG